MKKLIIALCLCATPAGAQSCVTTHTAGNAYTTCDDGSSAVTTNSAGNTYTTIQPGYGNGPAPPYKWVEPSPPARDGY